MYKLNFKDMNSFLPSFASKKVSLFVILIAFILPVFGGVVESPLTSGSSYISADKAANGANPGYTVMNDIIVTENNNVDFALTNGQFKTLILTAPMGWSFNTASGKLVYNKANDISAVSMEVTATNITLTFMVTRTTHFDAIRIAGIEVQAKDGAVINAPGKIYRSSLNPGTATMNNIVATSITDGSFGTSFGTLSQVSGSVAKLVFASKPGQSTANSKFVQQPVIITVDQFGNPTTKGLAAVQNVNVKLSSGSGTLAGTVVLNIGTSGGNGMVICDNLKINTGGVKKIIATSGTLTFAVSNHFIISEDGISTPSSDENPDWMCRL
jgi:hypothetical protein